MVGLGRGPADPAHRVKAAVDEDGRGGGAYKARPRGLGRPTKRSVTFIVFAVLLVLAVIAVVLAVLFP